MKPRWIKFQTVRLSKHRERILELLNNDGSALAEIEGALSRHFALKPDAVEEKDAEVRKDLERLADAISTINDILQNRGRARSLFLDASGEYIEDGTLLRFEKMEGAFFGDGGDLLVAAARSALVSLKVSPGRRLSPELNARLYLVGIVASAVGKIGMSPARGTEFEELIQFVYESAGIENDQGETIKADGDIRKWLERQRQSGAG